MKKLILLLTLAFTITANAQDDKTVTLTVSGQGKTQDEAKQVALRSAIEQAFGAFISSKTEILNDKLVKDEIVSVANGNIKSYQVLNEFKLIDGSYALTVSAIVAIDKLSNFVQSKGYTVDVKGGLFAMNIKQQMLNEEGEAKAICNIACVVHDFLQSSFDYEINSGDPYSLDGSNSNWGIPIRISVKTNNNFSSCGKYLTKNLSILALTDIELENYRSLKKNVFPITVKYNQIKKTYWFRNESSVSNLNYLLTDYAAYIRLFVVNSGILKTYGNEGVFYKNYNIANLLEIKDLKNEGIVFDFVDTGNSIASFSWVDNKTTEEIEKLTGYTIKPKGITSKYQCDENNKIKDLSIMNVPQNIEVLSQPEFPGGMNNMMKFISSHLGYPQVAKENGISGKCYIAFEIQADGKVGKIEIIRGIPGGDACDREAARVISEFPKFQPAVDLAGKPVSYWLQQRIGFSLR